MVLISAYLFTVVNAEEVANKRLSRFGAPNTSQATTQSQEKKTVPSPKESGIRHRQPGKGDLNLDDTQTPNKPQTGARLKPGDIQSKDQTDASKAKPGVAKYEEKKETIIAQEKTQKERTVNKAQLESPPQNFQLRERPLEAPTTTKPATIAAKRATAKPSSATTEIRTHKPEGRGTLKTTAQPPQLSAEEKLLQLLSQLLDCKVVSYF